MTTPLFSVIIPTQNRAPLLRQVLDSVLAQSGTDYEVIVVDDGSSDETPLLLAGYQSRVQILTQPNRGPGAARNLGAARARGMYLAFLDDDDLWFGWTLETYRQVLTRHSFPAFLAGKPYRFRHEDSLSDVPAEPLVTKGFTDYLHSSDQWCWWGASSFLVKQASFHKAGGFTSEWINGEDADLALRLGNAPGFVQVRAPATFAYREGAASAMQNFDRTLAGARFSLEQEQLGRYPGGVARAQARREILTRQLRPISLECLRRQDRAAAWQLYWATFWWHLRLGRIHYLIGFMWRAATRCL